MMATCIQIAESNAVLGAKPSSEYGVYPVSEASPLAATRLLNPRAASGDMCTALYELYKTPESLEGLLIVRNECPDSGNVYTVYNPCGMTGPPIVHGHEIIPGALPQKIKFDIDAKDANNPLPPNALAVILDTIIEEWMMVYMTYGIDCIDLSDILIFTSSTADISSYHLLIAPLRFAARSNDEVGEFVMRVRSRLPTDLQGFIDVGTNRPNQSFRMCGCTKRNSARLKRLMPRCDEDGNILPEPAWTSTLVSYCEGLELLPQVLSRAITPRAITCTNSQHSSPLVKYVLSAASAHTVGFTLRDIRVVSQGTDRGDADVVSTYIITFNRESSSHCALCARIHATDNSLVIVVYIRADDTMVAYVKCRRNAEKKSIKVCDLANISIHDPAVGSTSQPLSAIPTVKSVPVGEGANDPAATFVLAKTKFDTWKNRVEYCEPEMRPLVADGAAIPRTLCVDAPMKMGKTKKLLELIHARYGDDGGSARICILTFRQTFAQHIYERFAEAGFQVYNKVRGDLSGHNRIILQVESLHRLPIGNHFDMVIMDECESIIEQLDSGLFSQFGRSFAALIWLLKESSHLICMDAYIGDRTFQVLKKIRGLNEMQLHVNTFARASGDRYTITTNDGQWISELLASIDRGERVVVPCNSLEVANTLHDWITAETRSRTKVRVGLYSSETPPSIKVTHFADVDKYWAEYDVLIYTPTVSAGVSFEVAHYDRLFGYFTSSSCTVETAMQMMGRVRNIRKNTYTIYVRDNWWQNDYLPIDSQEIKEALRYKQWQILGPDANTSNLAMRYTSCGNCEVTDSDYLEIWTENTRVRNLSRKKFLSHFIATVQKAGAQVYRLEINTGSAMEYASLAKEFKDLKGMLVAHDSICVAKARDLNPTEYALIDKQIKDANTYTGGAPIVGDETLEEVLPAPEDVSREDIHAHDRYRLKAHYRIVPDAALNDDFKMKYGARTAKNIYWMIRGLTPVRAGTKTIQQTLDDISGDERTFILNGGATAAYVAAITPMPGDPSNMLGFIDSVADATLIAARYYSHLHRFIQRILEICGWAHLFDESAITYSRMYINLETHQNELRAMSRDIQVAFGTNSWNIPVVGSNERVIRTIIDNINALLDRYDMKIKGSAASKKESKTFTIRPVRELFRYSGHHQQFVVEPMPDEHFNFGPRY